MKKRFALAITALAVVAAPAAAARAPDDAQLRRLSGERGCTLCHRAEPPAPGADAGTPLAPSWREIAERYRGKPGADKRLAAIVRGGADRAERHWKDRAEFNEMRDNPRVSAAEANALVRWILASGRPRDR